MKVALATIFVFSALALGQTNLIANCSGQKDDESQWNMALHRRPIPNGDGSRYYENRKPKGPQDLVEYDFATSPTLKVPGDWNSQREDLLWYEGSVWYERNFSYQTSLRQRTFLLLRRGKLSCGGLSQWRKGGRTRRRIYAVQF